MQIFSKYCIKIWSCIKSRRRLTKGWNFVGINNNSWNDDSHEKSYWMRRIDDMEKDVCRKTKVTYKTKLWSRIKINQGTMPLQKPGCTSKLDWKAMSKCLYGWIVRGCGDIASWRFLYRKYYRDPLRLRLWLGLESYNNPIQSRRISIVYNSRWRVLYAKIGVISLLEWRMAKDWCWRKIAVAILCVAVTLKECTRTKTSQWRL